MFRNVFLLLITVSVFVLAILYTVKSGGVSERFWAEYVCFYVAAGGAGALPRAGVQLRVSAG